MVLLAVHFQRAVRREQLPRVEVWKGLNGAGDVRGGRALAVRTLYAGLCTGGSMLRVRRKMLQFADSRMAEAYKAPEGKPAECRDSSIPVGDKRQIAKARCSEHTGIYDRIPLWASSGRE